MILVVSYVKEAGGGHDGQARERRGGREGKYYVDNLNHHMNIHSDIKPTCNEPRSSVKIDEANICSICQPDVYLKAPSKKVSHRHLAMHKYIPTSSRKELSKCYVMCIRVDQLQDDSEPRQVCVHCGLRFTYLDGAWKRHVRREREEKSRETC